MQHPMTATPNKVSFFRTKQNKKLPRAEPRRLRCPWRKRGRPGVKKAKKKKIRHNEERGQSNVVPWREARKGERSEGKKGYVTVGKLREEGSMESRKISDANIMKKGCDRPGKNERCGTAKHDKVVGKNNGRGICNGGD